MARFPELTVSVQNLFASGQTGARRQPFQLVLRGPDIEGLDRYSQALAVAARTIPGMLDVDTTLSRRTPEIRVHIDRDKAADLGIGVDTIASSLRTMVGGEEVTKFREGDDQYPVRLRLQEDFRKNADVISQVYIGGGKRGLVSLNNLVRVTRGEGAEPDRPPGPRASGGRHRQPGPNATHRRRGEGDGARSSTAAKLPPGYTTQYLGRAQILAEARANFLIALGLSLIFIYMVLAAQFDSFVHPFTIMVSLPARAPLWALVAVATGCTMNIWSAIGVLMLFGVVKKNAILQVDYTNVLRERACPGTRPSSGPRPAAAHPDDDHLHHGGHDPHRPRQRATDRRHRPPWRRSSSGARPSACCSPSSSRPWSTPTSTTCARSGSGNSPSCPPGSGNGYGGSLRVFRIPFQGAGRPVRRAAAAGD